MRSTTEGAVWLWNESKARGNGLLLAGGSGTGVRGVPSACSAPFPWSAGVTGYGCAAARSFEDASIGRHAMPLGIGQLIPSGSENATALGAGP